MCPSADPLWVRVGDDEYAGHELRVDGEMVIGVVWLRLGHNDILPSGERLQRPPGYYFQAGPVVRGRLLEAADEPTAEGWERMRKRAVQAYEEWCAARAAASN